MFFLYERNIYLEKQVQTTQTTLEASQKALTALKEQKASQDKAIEQNAREKAKISSQLTKTQNELRKSHNEVLDKCAPAVIPDSISNRL